MPTNKKVNQYTGVMEKVVVLAQGTNVILGSGQRVWYANNKGKPLHTVELFDLKGNPLEPGWYTLQPVNEESKLVVINRTVQ